MLLFKGYALWPREELYKEPWSYEFKYCRYIVTDINDKYLNDKENIFYPNKPPIDRSNPQQYRPVYFKIEPKDLKHMKRIKIGYATTGYHPYWLYDERSQNWMCFRLDDPDLNNPHEFYMKKPKHYGAPIESIIPVYYYGK